MENRAVEFRAVSKSFGAVCANSNLSFSISKGTIHALIGENGAGKSTAMKILYGMQPADSGEIFLSNKKISFRTPLEAIAAGVGMVHQHFMLAGVHNVLDNILLGAENSAAFLPIRRQQAIKKIQEILNRYGWKLPLLEPIEQLPVGLQQRVEIVKLLYRDSNILILDEPTAVLTPSEAEELFSNLRELKTQGKTIILITHKLKEVMKIADKATVMRAGAVVAERDISQTSASELAELMVGRKVNLSRQVQPATFAGQPYVVAKNIFPDSDLQIYAGEIVGIAGVEGNGQKELIESLVFPGRNWSENTKVTIASQDISGWSTESLRKNGLGVLAQDRLAESLAPQFSAWENYLIGQDWRENFQHLGFLKNSQIKNNCLARMREYSVRPDDIYLSAAGFSGGNQQKLVVARELSQAPRFLIAAQPTRGVDVGAIEFIHQKILAAKESGAAILLISSELEEILRLADRILVLYNRKFVASLNPLQVSERELGIFMGGGQA